MRRIMVVDPPSGWQYGFPRELDLKEGEEFDQWLIDHGYPKRLIDEGMSKHCRYWCEEVDEEIDADSMLVKP